ncbi:PLP-dependent aminotransferase family protein [Fodinicola feengrottensis]|uniref:PLP-dependent aminotransferase family protein n=1 Tax=Fodinicola feengrottensis TaxID=435914 RepID=A0ABP4SLX8_9ACTN
MDLALDLAGPGPLHQRIAAALRDAIARGRLRPGERLPATRTLAADLGCSRWAVSMAYEQLVGEGWAEAVVGSGTRVVFGGSARPPDRPSSTVRYDLRPGYPGLSDFPRATWATAVRDAVRAAPATALGQPDPRGATELRETLSAYLGRVKGVRADPDAILVCAGVTHGISLMSGMLAADGASVVAVEDPGWPRIAEAVAAAGLDTVAVPVDEAGVRTNELPATASAAIVGPAHQFPTGVALAAARRDALVEWANGGRWILEDAYNSEHRYDGRPQLAIQGDAPDRVIHLGSVSKTLSPAVRVGWLVAPPAMVDRLADAMRVTGTAPSVVEQLALARLIDSGGYDRHLVRIRRVYRRRRDALVAALAAQLPKAQVCGAAGGLHLLVTFPADLDEDSLVRAAAAAGLLVSGLGRYYRGPQPWPGIVVGYANLGESAFPDAVRILAAAR